MNRQEKVLNLMGVKGECPGTGRRCPKQSTGKCSNGRMTIWKAIDDPEDGEPIDSLECDKCGLMVTVRKKIPKAVTTVERTT